MTSALRRAVSKSVGWCDGPAVARAVEQTRRGCGGAEESAEESGKVERVERSRKLLRVEYLSSFLCGGWWRIRGRDGSGCVWRMTSARKRSDDKLQAS